MYLSPTGRLEWERADRAANPEKYRERARRKYRANREKILAQVKAHQERNRDKICERKRAKYHSHTPEEKRRRALRTLYGITLEQYESLYASQSGQCAICLDAHPRLDVDHCHVSNTVRGLLCQRCNQGIGLLRENLTIMENAIKYINANKVLSK